MLENTSLLRTFSLSFGCLSIGVHTQFIFLFRLGVECVRGRRIRSFDVVALFFCMSSLGCARSFYVNIGHNAWDYTHFAISIFLEISFNEERKREIFRCLLQLHCAMTNPGGKHAKIRIKRLVTGWPALRARINDDVDENVGESGM